MNNKVRILISMRSDVAQSLHHSVSHNCGCVHREWSHHADCVSFEKSFHSMCLVTLSETLQSCLVFWVLQIIDLHHCLHIVKRIVECPIHRTSKTSCDERNIDWNVLLFCHSCRCQSVCHLFNCCEEQCESCSLSDCWGSLSSVKPSDSVLFKYLYNRIEWSWVNSFSFWSLNLDSNTSVFDWALWYKKNLPKWMN